MELVASARLRRAQMRIEAMRPYADRMLELMAGTAQAAGAVRLPLLERRETVQTVAIVPVTGDRGLAGAFNAQVLRRAFAEMREAQAWTGFSDKPAYSDAQAIAHAVAEAYIAGEVDRVLLVYNAFVSPLVQKVTVSEVLPIPTSVLEGAQEDKPSHPVDFFFEPEP